MKGEERVQPGIFGKVPAHRDFVQRHIPAWVIERWARWIDGWLYLFKEKTTGPWPQTFLNIPVWRFYISPGLLSEGGWIGLLAGSVDGIGRPFPYSIFVPSDNPGADSAMPLRFTPLLDRLEEHALAATRGNNTVFPEDISEFIPCFSSHEESMMTGDFLGKCQTQERGTTSECVWPLAGQDDLPLQTTFWWHDGQPMREPEKVVFQGLPPAAAMMGFLMGNWLDHGWKAYDGKAKSGTYLW